MTCAIFAPALPAPMTITPPNMGMSLPATVSTPSWTLMKFRMQVAGFAAPSAASQIIRADWRSSVVVLPLTIHRLGILGDALAHLLNGCAINGFWILFQVCIQLFENVVPFLHL